MLCFVCSCIFMLSVCFFFFFKQKTAYEMRISDWSSDVCSSDLVVHFGALRGRFGGAGADRLRPGIAIPIPDAVVDAIVIRDWIVEHAAVEPEIARLGLAHRREQREARDKIGRASCRERVCQYV